MIDRRQLCRRSAGYHAPFVARLLCASILPLGSPAASAPEQATGACNRALDSIVTKWRSIAVPGKPEPSEHVHTALEVWYMRSQSHLALRLCEDGKHREAMLRMDVVRAWLNLPEVRHPIDHRYRFDEDAR